MDMRRSGLFNLGARILVVVLALLLGLIAPVQATPPQAQPLEVITLEPDQDPVKPAVIVFLAAYRANGPPSGVLPFVSLRESPHPAVVTLYAYCGGDPVNQWDPSGLRAIVANDAGAEFSEWVGKNLSFWKGADASGFKFGYGFPENGEGSSRDWSLGWFGPTYSYTSKFSEIVPNFNHPDIQLRNFGDMTENDKMFAGMLADPSHTFIFEKSGWREATDADGATLGYGTDAAFNSAANQATYLALQGLNFTGELAIQIPQAGPTGPGLKMLAAAAGLAKATQLVAGTARLARVGGFADRIEQMGSAGFARFLNAGMQDLTRAKVSDWWNIRDDLGGATTPISSGALYTGHLSWANRIGLRQGMETRITNYDAAGSWFANTDTAVHEGFHALLARHVPSVWHAGDFAPFGIPLGAPVKYLEEVAAYSAGHAASLRLHGIPLTPLEAFGSLSAKEGAFVIGTGVVGAGGAAGYWYSTQGRR